MCVGRKSFKRGSIFPIVGEKSHDILLYKAVFQHQTCPAVVCSQMLPQTFLAIGLKISLILFGGHPSMHMQFSSQRYILCSISLCEYYTILKSVYPTEIVLNEIRAKAISYNGHWRKISLYYVLRFANPMAFPRITET